MTQYSIAGTAGHNKFTVKTIVHRAFAVAVRIIARTPTNKPCKKPPTHNNIATNNGRSIISFTGILQHCRMKAPICEYENCHSVNNSCKNISSCFCCSTVCSLSCEDEIEDCEESGLLVAVECVLRAASNCACCCA